MEAKKYFKTGIFFLALLFFSFCSVGVMYQIYMEQTFHIYKESLRFHVRAEDDSEVAQEKKLAVRDAVLAILEEEVKEASSAQSLEQRLKKKIKEICEAAIAAQKEESQDGEAASVKVYFTTERFPIREYGTAVFPAGNYRALRIDLGAAKGRNWWCAFYPNLCYTPEKKFSLTKKGKKDAAKKLLKKEIKLLFGKKIKIRFKIFNWFGKQ